MSSFDRLTEDEAVALMHKKLVNHAVTNRGMSFDQVIDDVVAYFCVRFGLQRSQGHAAMSAFLYKYTDAVVADLRAKGIDA